MNLTKHTNSEYKYGALYRAEKNYHKIEFYQIIKQQFKVMIKCVSVKHELNSNHGDIINGKYLIVMFVIVSQDCYTTYKIALSIIFILFTIHWLIV